MTTESFVHCGYCGSDAHMAAEWPMAVELREYDEDDDEHGKAW